MDLRDTLARVVTSLYQATLDAAHWPATSALIDEACGLGGNALVVAEGFGDDARVFSARFYTRGQRRQDMEREYFQDFHSRDERVPRLRQLPDGQLVPARNLFTDTELKTSPAYNEWLSGHGGENGIVTRLDGPDGSRVVWASIGPTASAGWGSAQIELIEGILPHLRQYVSVRRALANAEALNAARYLLLDNARLGVIHLERRGRIVAANECALAVLRRGDGLFDRDGILRAWLPADHSRLQKLLAAALPTFMSGKPPTGASMTVRRACGPPRLGLHVIPVGCGEPDCGGRVAALVLVVDPATRPRIDPRRVTVMLGLTPAEGRVAALLAEGRSVPDIAATTGYQVSYVRWLLKQIYRKQGLSGQVDLVRLVLSMTGL